MTTGTFILYYFILIIMLFIIFVCMLDYWRIRLYLIVYQIETWAQVGKGALHISKYLRDVNESAERAPVIPES